MQGPCSLLCSAANQRKCYKETLARRVGGSGGENPDRIDEYDAYIATAAVGAAEVQTTPAVDDVNESIAKFLFKACVEQVETGDHLVTALELVISS